MDWNREIAIRHTCDVPTVVSESWIEKVYRTTLLFARVPRQVYRIRKFDTHEQHTLTHIDSRDRQVLLKRMAYYFSSVQIFPYVVHGTQRTHSQTIAEHIEGADGAFIGSEQMVCAGLRRFGELNEQQNHNRREHSNKTNLCVFEQLSPMRLHMFVAFAKPSVCVWSERRASRRKKKELNDNNNRAGIISDNYYYYGHFKLNRNIAHKYCWTGSHSLHLPTAIPSFGSRETFACAISKLALLRDKAQAERSKSDLVPLCENSICDWWYI